MSSQAKIISSSELPASEARWVALKELEWQDREGKQRRSAQNARYAAIDAVAILAVIVIQSAKNTFAPSTVIIEQYRPPMDEQIMKLAVLGVEGEHICKRAVELHRLYDELQDTLRL